MEPIRILTANIDKPDSASIETYLAGGGYADARKALTTMKPDEVVQLVKDSELRGRGGAGFPTGAKWGFVPKNAPKPTYLLCNADESEPGTFKDRVIIEKDPHLLIEGMIISAFAISSCPMSYIYIRGEFHYGSTVLEKALAEARQKGFLGKNVFGSGFDFDITVHRGAGAYICGEETGLIESVEGHRGQPRVKPPFPAVIGVFGGPTVVQNVETIACVPLIVRNGADWFKSFGSPKNTGPKLYCVSGNVKKPGVYEFPMGITIKELIYDHCGGITGDRKLKAVIPGGASAPMLTPDEIDIPLNFDALMKAGSMLGSAGIIVLDESVCIVDAVWRLAKFFAHESCGQCTPCREGTNWMESVLDRLERGDRLWERKRQAVEQTPGLTVWRGGETFDQIGGCDNIKRFLTAILHGQEAPRVIVFVDEIEKAFAGTGTDMSGVKTEMTGTMLSWMQDRGADGLIFIGPAGAAKSAVAKSAGATAGIPTVAFDLSAMQNSLVGGSGERLRAALQVVDAISQGRSLWIATCNSITTLPPELRRRFTLGTFFFDLPAAAERKAIWEIYLQKWHLSGELPDDEGWTGAEIKECCRKAWRLKLSLRESAEYIVPVSRSAADQIESLRRQASGRFLDAAQPGVFSAESRQMTAAAGKRTFREAE